jgi:hypothetical protein
LTSSQVTAFDLPDAQKLLAKYDPDVLRGYRFKNNVVNFFDEDGNPFHPISAESKMPAGSLVMLWVKLKTSVVSSAFLRLFGVF